MIIASASSKLSFEVPAWSSNSNGNIIFIFGRFHLVSHGGQSCEQSRLHQNVSFWAELAENYPEFGYFQVDQSSKPSLQYHHLYSNHYSWAKTGAWETFEGLVNQCSLSLLPYWSKVFEFLNFPNLILMYPLFRFFVQFLLVVLKFKLIITNIFGEVLSNFQDHKNWNIWADTINFNLGAYEFL